MCTLLRPIFVLSVLFNFGCSSDLQTTAASSSGGGGSTVSIPSSVSLTVKQNDSETINLNPDATAFPTATVSITSHPTYGDVNVSGTSVEYVTTNATFSGADQFTYKIIVGSIESDVGTVDVTITPLTSGLHVFTENYAGGTFSLSGWQTRSSTFGHLNGQLVGFGSGFYNSVATDFREISVIPKSGSYGGDPAYNAIFGVLPVDGSGGAMNDWPWTADYIHIPDCVYTVTITAKIRYASVNPLFNMMLNYRFNDDNTLTGYKVLVNSGANGMILHKFENAHERATSYMDRWPGHAAEGLANPVTYGPIKAWDRDVGTFPAGGIVASSQTDVFIAILYSYDPVTGDTTIGYESRLDNGTDNTPGVWDNQRTLTGADSLPPGGAFGILNTAYHSGNSTALTSHIRISEFQLSCTVP